MATAKPKRTYTIHVEGHADVVAEYNVQATSPEEAVKIFEDNPQSATPAKPPVIVNLPRMRKYRLFVNGTHVRKSY